MPHDASPGKCKACGEEGWVRTLKADYARFKRGDELCRACFREVTTGAIAPQTTYFSKKTGKSEPKHTEPDRTE